jgi:hypothetical protein
VSTELEWAIEWEVKLAQVWEIEWAREWEMKLVQVLAIESELALGST